MDWLSLAFERPAYLLLLLLVPVVWLIGRRSLASVGRGRYFVAASVRSVVVILLALALAEVQLVRVSERIAALFLVDQSASIAPRDREAVFDYVRTAAERHRDAKIGDAAGVIVFGREAQIEHPPLSDAPLPLARQTPLDAERSNIAAALRLAKASFPPGMAKRVVVVSDGNQNLGDALTEARLLASDGVGIDVAPLPARPVADVVVSKITTPADVRVGVPFNVTIVVENHSPPTARRPESVPGRLVVTRLVAGVGHLVADERIELPPGKQVFQFKQQLEESAFYSYEAKFVPDDPRQDRFTQNNLATSYTQIRGQGRCLFIVNDENPVEFDHLIAGLRRHEIDVTVQTTAALFGSLAELQNYDCVVLANVPRTSGDTADKLVQFSEEQIDMLVKNVEQFGAGLVMLGGPDSFGAGGWTNTKLEAAMPVDFQVKNAKVAAVGALMLVIDKSGSMDGIKIQMCKAAAKAAVEMLGPLDQLGVIAFDSAAEDVVRLQRVGDRPGRMQSQIDRLASGGGTNMEPAVRRGYEALRRINSSVKHMIILTDGQTNGSGYSELAGRMRKENITTTTVAVGTDAAKTLLQDIAGRGGGKYYQAFNPRVLPRIFTKETRRVVRPLLFEEPAGLALQMQDQHEILAGIRGDLPPITGYVLTTLKENPLVEAPLVAPKPGAPNNTVLATWNYGLGRSVAFTTDSGQRWAKEWPAWGDYEKLFVQTVRWSMRSIADHGNFSLATTIEDGQLQVVLQALTEDGEFLNNLPVEGNLVGDSAEQSAEMRFEQTGPGRYRAVLPLDGLGTRLLAVRAGPGHGILRAGVNVPYSPEFRYQDNNEPLLMSLAQMQPAGGQHGEVIRLPDDAAQWSRFAGANVFRRDLARARSLTGVWPLALLVAAGLFLFDVGHRRLVFSPAGFTDAVRRIFPRGAPPVAASDARLDRLKAKKSEAAAASARAQRFEPQTGAQPIALEPLTRETSPPSPAESVPPEQAREAEGYSSRLLQAKRDARRAGVQRNSPDSALGSE